jgi:hypothetical protein
VLEIEFVRHRPGCTQTNSQAECLLRGLTLELTGPQRRDGLARAVMMHHVPQAGPRQPAVAGPVERRG